MTLTIAHSKATKALYALWVFWIASAVLLGLSQVLVWPKTEISLSLLFSGILLWAVKASPLLAAFFPLRKRSHRAATWLAYACLFYFLIWMLVCFTPNRSELGTLGLIATSGLFVSCLLFTRWEKRFQAALFKPETLASNPGTVDSDSKTVGSNSKAVDSNPKAVDSKL